MPRTFNKTGRSKHGPSGLLNKLQRKWISPPRDKPWARIFIDTMDSEAWRSLSVHERRMLDALICQHFSYYQKSNGELEISYSYFERLGITRRSYVAAAKERLIALGLIRVTRGENKKPHLMPPNRYEILFYREPQRFKEQATRRFVWVPIEVMESPAWCGLSINARRIMDRLLTENMRHKGEANGRLRVSYQQFIGHGLPSPNSVTDATKELTTASLLDVTKSPPMGAFKGPNLYRITFLGTVDGPATWQAPPQIISLPKKPKRQSRKSTLADDFKRRAVNER
jgi:hypothetical protein